MLILSRNPGESILIGRQIEVLVTKVTPPYRVYLGITAPRAWDIARSEIVKDISDMKDEVEPLRGANERLREVLHEVDEEMGKALREFLSVPVVERPDDLLGYVMRCVTDAQAIIRKELAE